MKKRIKIDGTLMSFTIVLTGFLYWFPNIYFTNHLFDTIFDVIGIVVLLKGVLLRMSARGHKKAKSAKSKALVVTGPYSITRNPMYFGSFMIGAGYLFMVWPWWTLPIFAGIFYFRFKQEVEKEEKLLSEAFGDEYKEYCERVPRVIPDLKKVYKMKLSEIFDPNEAFSTKEKRGLIGCVLLGVFLEVLQESVIFGQTNINEVMAVFACVIIVFFVGVKIYSKIR